jgi:uncharacterized membrane protein YcaP (DUF421 family)
MSLFSLTMPWYMFVIRGAIAYIGLLVLLRLAGKRTFGELSAIDIVVLILVGGTLRTAIVGDDNSLLGAFIGVATILALDRCIAFFAARAPRINRLVEGRPAVLARYGLVDREALRRNNVPMAMFERALRSQGVRSIGDVIEARLEPNGKITVVSR